MQTFENVGFACRVYTFKYYNRPASAMLTVSKLYVYVLLTLIYLKHFFKLRKYVVYYWETLHHLFMLYYSYFNRNIIRSAICIIFMYYICLGQWFLSEKSPVIYQSNKQKSTIIYVSWFINNNLFLRRRADVNIKINKLLFYL